MKPIAIFLVYLFFVIPTCHARARASSQFADFVIVGAGTAGCALAGRLCESLPNATILLFERGQPREKQSEFIVRSPNNALRAWNDPQIVETYESEPGQGLLGRRSVIITGKTLGGSSSVNGMQWTVPIEGTVDRWGISGLTSRTWMKYLQRAYRTVSFGQPAESLQQINTDDYIQAARRAGFQEEGDQFSEEITNGVWLNRLAIDDNARRVDSCTAYVSSVIGSKCRRNLQIVQSETVTRVLLNEESPPRAVGVEFIKSGGRKQEAKTVFAKKEVLVAAGPFESPKLLQLSGIGPKKVLWKAGVPLRVDLPVGTGSQGRVGIAVTADSASAPPEPSKNETLLNSSEQRMKWKRGEGGLLGVAQSAVNGRMRRKAYYTAALGVSNSGTRLRVQSICFLNTNSFGYVRIRDSNPFSKPHVHLNVLSKTSDVRNGVSCMRGLRRIHGGFEKSFKLTEVFPGDTDITEELVRKNSSFAFHFVGACSVGKTVNEFLKVKGVEGLRVIDSSVLKIMPVSAGPLSKAY